MKHSKIIQENLDKRDSPKEKVNYLIYAYKEWLIGISLAIIILLVFIFSINNATRPDLSIRVITDSPISSEKMDTLSKEISSHLPDETVIDIQHYLIGGTEQQQVFMAQVAAKEIDFLVTEENSSNEVQLLVNEMSDPEERFTVSDFVFSPLLNAPHLDSIEILKKAHSSYNVEPLSRT